MSKLFTHSRKSSRLQNWDYGWKGLYFVTIKTKFCENYFGDINNGQMLLNEIGLRVADEWLLSPTYRPDMNLILDEFIVMPNHFHGVIGIGRNEFNIFPDSASEFNLFQIGESDAYSRFKINSGIPINSFGPQRKNLAAIIRGFKG